MSVSSTLSSFYHPSTTPSQTIDIDRVADKGWALNVDIIPHENHPPEVRARTRAEQLDAETKGRPNDSDLIKGRRIIIAHRRRLSN